MPMTLAPALTCNVTTAQQVLQFAEDNGLVVVTQQTFNNYTIMICIIGIGIGLMMCYTYLKTQEYIERRNKPAAGEPGTD